VARLAGRTEDARAAFSITVGSGRARVVSLLALALALLVVGCAPATPAVAPKRTDVPPAAIDPPLQAASDLAALARARQEGRYLAPAPTFPFTPQPDWLPTPVDHDVGRDGAPVSFIVIHYTDLSYERTLRAFNSPNSG